MAALSSIDSTGSCELESHATSDGEIIGRVELPEDASAVLRGGEAAKAADYDIFDFDG